MNPEFIISLPGFDAKTATPEQCALHSGYDTLKIKLDSNNPQFGNLTVTFADNPAAGTYTVTTIHHGYGYIPAFFLYWDERNSSNPLNFSDIGPPFYLDELLDRGFIAVIDNQNITIQFTVAVGSAGDITGQFFAFRYYIFANPGQ